jgi:hypothetical protein
MSQPPMLEEFLKRINEVAEKEFFEAGRLTPTYVFFTKKHGIMLIPMTIADKDLAVALIKCAFEEFEAEAYVFYDEAWVWQAPMGTKREDMPANLSNHPDRKEIIHLTGEDYISGMIMAQRSITRVEGEPPKLGPLEITSKDFSQMEGRLVGLLPQRGRAN